MSRKSIIIIFAVIVLLMFSIAVYMIQYNIPMQEENVQENIIPNSSIQENSVSDNTIQENSVSDNTIQESDILKGDNMSVTMRAVVVQVKENSLYVMEITNKELDSVTYKNEDIDKFKQGQEVLIYFDGLVATMYPGIIDNVGKIEIIKEKSDIEITKEILRYCYSSRENVSISVLELTNTGLTLTITDTNELQYSYPNKYVISQKLKNEAYTGVGYELSEETACSTSSYVRNWSRIYMASFRKK